MAIEMDWGKDGEIITHRIIRKETNEITASKAVCCLFMD